MKVILSVLPFLIIIGCRQTERKKIFYTFPNGIVGEVRYYENSGDSLTYRKEAFYSNGAKGYIGNVVNGKKNGIWIWWYPNGNKKDQCKYLKGREIDTLYHWYKNGIIKQIEIPWIGRRLTDSCNPCNGTIIRYFENGKPQSMFKNIDDIPQDTGKRWYDNGQLEWYAVYKNGKENGISEVFYKNGQKEKSGRLVNGLLDGDVTYWDSLGKIVSVTKYKLGTITN